MSIIFDALKKSQGDNPEDEPKKDQSNVEQATSTPAEKPVVSNYNDEEKAPEEKKPSNIKEILIKVIAFTFLLGCLAFFASSVTKQAKKIKSGSTRQSSSGSIIEKAKAKFAILKFKATTKKKNKKKKRNKSKQTKKSKVYVDKSGYSLQGIIFSNNSPMAIINDKTCSIGDKSGQAIVKHISETSVILETTEGNIVLKLE